MKAFISYSHQDATMLSHFHKHLAQLKRDNILEAWTDEAIPAGGKIDKKVSAALNNSGLFLALLSPDYIDSRYCYEKEFEKALEREDKGEMIIVPVILQPCDWHNTPFQQFKALPKDGKPVSSWENINTAFLDVVQELRRLIQYNINPIITEAETKNTTTLPSRNYKVEKDFDSIEKLQFVETSFIELNEYLKRYILEVNQVENIKAMVYAEEKDKFHCYIVNRNKIDTEAQLIISTKEDNSFQSYNSPREKVISISIVQNNRPEEKKYQMKVDKFHLFWVESSHFYLPNQPEKTIKEIADSIWSDLLKSVGIMF
jgi:hypothetical protein